MSKQAETKDLEKFIETLKSLHSKLQWVKMHGSMYQSGVPDVWLMIKRQNIMIEFKKARPRTIARLLFLCRVMQRKRLLDMARLRCPGFILCSSPDSKTWAGVRVADLLQEDLNVKLEYVSIEEMAKFLLDNV